MLSPTDLRQLAERGAHTRLEEIKREMAALLEAFPTLNDGTPATRRAAAPAEPEATHDIAMPAPARKKQRFSRAQRAAIGRRMKKYWKAQREAKNGSSNGASAR